MFEILYFAVPENSRSFGFKNLVPFSLFITRQAVVDKTGHGAVDNNISMTFVTHVSHKQYSTIEVIYGNTRVAPECATCGSSIDI